MAEIARHNFTQRQTLPPRFAGAVFWKKKGIPMELAPIAYIHTAFPEKFGIPRQSGLVMQARGEIVFTEPYRDPQALRGIEAYSHLWLIFGFSKVESRGFQPTVRPPRLGGNTRMGVFATRSPYRPNPLGLSCVGLREVREVPGKGTVLLVDGVDLLDQTPIYDIKPYLRIADCHPDAVCGFAEKTEAYCLPVSIPAEIARLLPAQDLEAIRALLAQDPRPAYQEDPARVYGMRYGIWEVFFTVDTAVQVCRIEKRGESATNSF